MNKRDMILDKSNQENHSQLTSPYHRWLLKAEQNQLTDPDVVRELREMKDDKKRIEEAFYRELAFGTGGLRGIIGAGTSRMNVHTVARASQGLADYVLKERGNAMESLETKAEGCRIAVSYDSRIKSRLFAEVVCRVFAANGMKACLYPELMPTPCLSFAVRRLGCDAGVMVTASHNPKEYNGYKVYGPDGCQITVEAAEAIYREITKLDMFDDIRLMDFDEGVKLGRIAYISPEVYTDFIEEVKAQSVVGDEPVNKDLSIVYTPLNGTGLKPVLRVLKESGYTNVTVVKEQEEADGNFPTCPYPNPEAAEALLLGIEQAKEREAALVVATDPDCDRVGIAVRDRQGRYVLLTGNETGVLLLDYVCSRRTAEGTMPGNPVMAKTIVTTDMGERIAEHYGVRTVNVLTGFKFIGEQIGKLEDQGREGDFIFAFEESYGYLSGSYVRDKDGVGGAFLICEMCAWYEARGINLVDKLNDLYETYGFYMDKLHSYTFAGVEGFEQMERLMEDLRKGPVIIGGRKAEKVMDYGLGIDGLPRSNVLKCLLGPRGAVVIRPSGTEPKLKVYLSARAGDRQAAEQMEAELAESFEALIFEKREDLPK